MEDIILTGLLIFIWSGVFFLMAIIGTIVAVVIVSTGAMDLSGRGNGTAGMQGGEALPTDTRVSGNDGKVVGTF